MATIEQDGTAAIEGGFTDAVYQSQAVFRVLMDAMARPASIHPLDVATEPPLPLSSTAGAIICALADADAPVWLDPALSAKGEVKAWLAFHTGAPIAELEADAVFALVSEAPSMPALQGFAQGTHEYPDRSTSIIIQVEALTGGKQLDFEGPGIEASASIAPVGLPEHFHLQWAANRARFPRGVDLILCGPTEIACLPRSAKLITREE